MRQPAEAPLRCAPPQARTARRVVVFSAPKQEQIEAAIKVRGSGAREPLASPPRRWGGGPCCQSHRDRRPPPPPLGAPAGWQRATAARSGWEAVQPCLRPPPPPPPDRHTGRAGPLQAALPHPCRNSPAPHPLPACCRRPRRPARAARPASGECPVRAQDSRGMLSPPAVQPCLHARSRCPACRRAGCCHAIFELVPRCASAAAAATADAIRASPWGPGPAPPPIAPSALSLHSSLPLQRRCLGHRGGAVRRCLPRQGVCGQRRPAGGREYRFRCVFVCRPAICSMAQQAPSCTARGWAALEVLAAQRSTWWCSLDARGVTAAAS